MDIKEIFVLICLWFINIYNNVIDYFKSKKIKEEVKEVKEVDDESNNEHQLLLEELAEEVIERLSEKYHLFKKD